MKELESTITTTYNLPFSQAEGLLIYEQQSDVRFDAMMDKLREIEGIRDIKLCEFGDEFSFEYSALGRLKAETHEAIRKVFEQTLLAEHFKSTSDRPYGLPEALAEKASASGLEVEEVRDILLAYASTDASKGGSESNHVLRLKQRFHRPARRQPASALSSAYAEPLRRTEEFGWNAERHVRCLMDFILQHREPIGGTWSDSSKRLEAFIGAERERDMQILADLANDEPMPTPKGM